MSAALKTGADERAMRRTKFPEEFNKKVDMSKVNLDVIKKWVKDEVARILNTDDDVVTGMIFDILQGSRTVRTCPYYARARAPLTDFLAAQHQKATD